MTALSRMTDPSYGTSLSWLTASLLSLLWRWELPYLFPQLFFSPSVASYPQFKVFFFVFVSHYHFVVKCVMDCMCIGGFVRMLSSVQHLCVSACGCMCECLYMCSNCCSTWAKYGRKSVDRRHSSLIAWLINQLHWLHVDLGLLSGGLARALYEPIMIPWPMGVKASSGLLHSCGNTTQYRSLQSAHTLTKSSSFLEV